MSEEYTNWTTFRHFKIGSYVWVYHEGRGIQCGVEGVNADLDRANGSRLVYILRHSYFRTINNQIEYDSKWVFESKEALIKSI